MASEKQISLSFTASKGVVANKISIQESMIYDWTAALKVGQTDLILSVTGAAISKGSITNVDAIFIKNQEQAAGITILYTLDGTNYFGSIAPGCFAWIPVIPAIDVTNFKIKSASGTPTCSYAVIGV
jgi:hypothetical protein